MPSKASALTSNEWTCLAMILLLSLRTSPRCSSDLLLIIRYKIALNLSTGSVIQIVIKMKLQPSKIVINSTLRTLTRKTKQPSMKILMIVFRRRKEGVLGRFSSTSIAPKITQAKSNHSADWAPSSLSIGLRKFQTCKSRKMPCSASMNLHAQICFRTRARNTIFRMIMREVRSSWHGIKCLTNQFPSSIITSHRSSRKSNQSSLPAKSMK